MAPSLLIISDFPIVVASAEMVFGDRFRVVKRTWAQYAACPERDANLVVVDVTTVSAELALGALTPLLPMARVAVCSLHRNEVELYRVDADGLCAEGAVPSLLALVA
jgi:hypothetical protein